MHLKQNLKQKWAILLGGMVSPSFPGDAIEAITDMLPLFDFPDEAFCTESAKAVARAKRRQPCPSFDEIEGALTVWWQKNRPPQATLAAPGAAPMLEPADESWLKTFRKHEENNYASYGAFARETGVWHDSPVAAARDHLLRMLDRLAPPAAKIARSEVEVAEKNLPAHKVSFARQCPD